MYRMIINDIALQPFLEVPQHFTLFAPLGFQKFHPLRSVIVEGGPSTPQRAPHRNPEPLRTLNLVELGHGFKSVRTVQIEPIGQIDPLTFQTFLGTCLRKPRLR